MDQKLKKLMCLAKKYDATDLHFEVKKNRLKISMRGRNGMKEICDDEFQVGLFHYLKYLANLDLGNGSIPQSGQFVYRDEEVMYYCRFSFLATYQVETGVLRILNNHEPLTVKDLSYKKSCYRSFLRWCHLRGGFVIVSGPTGSGKSTTLHALLEEIAKSSHLKVISLEDPIEIQSDDYLQLQINEKVNFTYEEGIKTVLRHDPDVLMIGEIRDAISAKMALRAALTGHMVFSSLHAKTASQALLRLHELGVSWEDMENCISAVTNQRIFNGKKKKGRICIYEILEKDELEYFFKEKRNHEKHKDIFDEIKEAVDLQLIFKKDGEKDIL